MTLTPSAGTQMRLRDVLIFNLRNLRNVRGRMSRGLFWPYVAVVLGAWLVSLFLASILLQGTSSGYFANGVEATEGWSTASNLIILISSASVALLISSTVRRLHDVGRSGFWGLPALVLLLCSFASIAYHMNESAPIIAFTIGLLYLIALSILIILLIQPSKPDPNPFVELR